MTETPEPLHPDQECCSLPEREWPLRNISLKLHAKPLNILRRPGKRWKARNNSMITNFTGGGDE